MANNYTESSSIIEIPKEKRDQADQIINRVVEELKSSEDECCGFEATQDTDGVWIRHNESINVEHAELLVRSLVEELDLPGVHVVSWANTCSKPRIDEFGGGAFAVMKGCETAWVDAAEEVKKKVLRSAGEKNELTQLFDQMAEEVKPPQAPWC